MLVSLYLSELNATDVAASLLTHSNALVIEMNKLHHKIKEDEEARLSHEAMYTEYVRIKALYDSVLDAMVVAEDVYSKV